jgi:Leu/Phe-tRNA-protein transferase
VAIAARIHHECQCFVDTRLRFPPDIWLEVYQAGIFPPLSERRQVKVNFQVAIAARIHHECQCLVDTRQRFPPDIWLEIYQAGIFPPFFLSEGRLKLIFRWLLQRVSTMSAKVLWIRNSDRVAQKSFVPNRKALPNLEGFFWEENFFREVYPPYIWLEVYQAGIFPLCLKGG